MKADALCQPTQHSYLIYLLSLLPTRAHAHTYAHTQKGANVDHDGDSALVLAAQNGKLPVVQLLAERGANLEHNKVSERIAPLQAL